jgi:hypothetical protein
MSCEVLSGVRDSEYYGAKYVDCLAGQQRSSKGDPRLFREMLVYINEMVGQIQLIGLNSPNVSG